MANESTNYSGPDTNPVYSDDETFESFDDMDTFEDDEQEADEEQSTTSHEGAGDDDKEEAEEEQGQTKKSAKVLKKEAEKKARGQKGDDLDTLEREDSFDDLDEEAAEKPAKKEEKEDEDEEEAEATKDEPAKEETEAQKKEKIKPTYIEIDGQTFKLQSNAIISVPVDGKNEKVTLQELKNNYSGKVFHDKRINEVNVKEQGVKRLEADVTQKLSHFNSVKQKIDEIIKDETKDPLDALKIFLDSAGVDSYDYTERVFKANLTELSNVLNMEPAERKAYFLEKKNSHLTALEQKRNERAQSDQRVTSYKQKVDALRNSFSVSEAQYVDALEELKGFEQDEKNITEQDIVEWAATKPHRPVVDSLLAPYRDQLPEGSYGDLAWKLAHVLREGKETAETIKKNLATIYGTPTEVKELSKQLNPLGRKSKPEAKILSPKKSYESFDDIDDD